jgi:hypothetical protein
MNGSGISVLALAMSTISGKSVWPAAPLEGDLAATG